MGGWKGSKATDCGSVVYDQVFFSLAGRDLMVDQKIQNFLRKMKDRDLVEPLYGFSDLRTED